MKAGVSRLTSFRSKPTSYQTAPSDAPSPVTYPFPRNGFTFAQFAKLFAVGLCGLVVLILTLGNLALLLGHEWFVYSCGDDELFAFRHRLPHADCVFKESRKLNLWFEFSWGALGSFLFLLCTLPFVTGFTALMQNNADNRAFETSYVRMQQGDVRDSEFPQLQRQVRFFKKLFWVAVILLPMTAFACVPVADYNGHAFVMFLNRTQMTALNIAYMVVLPLYLLFVWASGEKTSPSDTETTDIVRLFYCCYLIVVLVFSVVYFVLVVDEYSRFATYFEPAKPKGDGLQPYSVWMLFSPLFGIICNL